MKYVWAIIGGLLVAAGVLLFRGDPGPVGRSRPPASSSSPAVDARASNGPESEPKPEPDPETQALSDSTTKASDAIEATTWILSDGDTLPELARRRYGDERLWRRIVDANPRLAAGELQLGDEIVLPDLQDIPDPVIDAAALVADLDSGREERGSDDASSADARSRIEVPEGAPTLDLGLDREIPDATVTPGSLVQDGDSIIADAEFRIRGSGTQEDPYLVSWELLSSAADGYRPSLGERSIPQRVAALDGQWVRIDGYVAFPLGGADTSELLVMLNQWDGCCIGIPPTPYDAIEVSLEKAIPPGQRHSINFGTLTGKLLVSPYLVENWLVGLYLMDDATVRFEL
ncbi:MAG: hypothetical protein CMJ67_08635 [Planctomycetaceae bacterium]|nr:hypothetical protein [Planctomycetaceae bacterium]